MLLVGGQGGERWPAGTLALRGKPENSAAPSESSPPATAPRAARMFLWHHLVSEAQTTSWRERQGPQTEAPPPPPPPDLGPGLSSRGPVNTLPLHKKPPKTSVSAATKPK